MSSRTDAALVLSSPVAIPHAHQACAKLGEKLWYPSESNGDFLQYLSYQNLPGPYWIAGRHGRYCNAFSADGKQTLQDCFDRLPVLCTQSAPLSNFTDADNSTQWRTTVATGQQTLTGFRDRFSFRFEGVRYAAEPERWTYSTPYVSTGHSDALDLGPECVQGATAGSTDCLFLNVWTPYLPNDQAEAQKLKPVMLWIHGESVLRP